MVFATCESSTVVLLAAFHLSPGSFSALLCLCQQPQTSGTAGALSYSSSLWSCSIGLCPQILFHRWCPWFPVSIIDPFHESAQLPDPPSSCARPPHPFQPRSHRARVNFPPPPLQWIISQGELCTPTPTVVSSYYTCVLGLWIVSISKKS